MAGKNAFVQAAPKDKTAASLLPKGNMEIQPLPKPPKRGDAELPVQQPGGNAQTMGTTAVSHTVKDTGNDSPTANEGYKSLNEQIWGEGGSKLEGYDAYVEQTKQELNPTGSMTMEEYMAMLTPHGNAEYEAWLEKNGKDAQQYYPGGYNQDGTGTPTNLPGTNEEGWFYTEGGYRPVQAGTSGADEDLTSPQGYAYIRYCQEQYAKCKENGDTAGMTYWHNEAEKTRAGSGYSGGADGSMYIPLANLGVDTGTGNNYPDLPGPDSGADDTPEGRMQALLDAWKEAAEEQATASVDYAVQQAIKEYERILEDAQEQFKEQAESVSRDERNAMDNAALYAELRGDRGGIGQEQYSSIQNTAAQNRLAIQQAQTKLATDTARTIEDLRVQGEFEKADAVLEITQEYLAQLLSLEQWAAEYNFSVEQFNASLKQWEAEYNLKLEQLGIAQEQWKAEYDLRLEQMDVAQEQWQQEFNYEKYMDSVSLGLKQENQLAEVGWTMLEMGLMPDEKYLDAMKLDQSTAAQMIAMLGDGVTANEGFVDPWEIYQMLYDNDYTSESDTAEIADFLRTMGVDNEMVNSYARQYIARGYEQIYRDTVPTDIGPGINMTNAQEFGYISWPGY